MTDMQSQYRYISFTDETPYCRFVQVKRPDTEKDPAPGKTATNIPQTHGSYGPLLFHEKWKLKRKEILTRDSYRCMHCKSSQNLQVHHRQYHFIVSQQKFRLPWDYPDHLLITLCESCHTKGHNKYKVPSINV